MAGSCDYDVVSISPNSQANNGDKLFCSSGGEAKAYLVLELLEPAIIHTIEIVNANSTNIEIFVFNEQGGEEETLLPTSSMMTFGELSKHVNTNRLRFFGSDKFTKGVFDKPWKFVKITCSTLDAQQPYGVERVKIFSSAPSSGYKDTVIADNRATIEPTVLLSQPTCPSASEKYCASRRTKSFTGAMPTTKLHTDNKENKNKNTPSPPKSKSTNTNPNTTPTTTTKRKRVIANDDFDDDPVGNIRTNYTPRSLTTADVTAKKAQHLVSNKSKSLVFTPFSKILSGVMIVVSGIQNPERSELRDKATAMGAEYFPDWIASATHLVCRFTNTPKANMALKSGGTLVKPEWIDACYKTEVRLPEEGYLLAAPIKADMSSTMGNMCDWLTKFKPVKNDSFRSDAKPTNSNSTKYDATISKPIKSCTFVNNARISTANDAEDIDDSASGTTETMSDSDKPDTLEDAAPPAKVQKTESTKSDITEEMEIPTQETAELLSSSEDDTTNKQGTRKTSTFSGGTLTRKGSSSSLPSYFYQVKAVLKGNFDPAMRSLLYRYITAYSGEIENKVTPNTSHVVTNQVWSEELQRLQEKYPSLSFVRPSWVFESHNEQQCADVTSHSVTA